MKKNPIAVALGMMAKGVPKTLSAEQREAKRQRMQAMNARRAARVDLAECPTCGREMPSGRCVICDEPAPDEGQ